MSRATMPARRADLVVEVVGDEAVVYDPRTQRASALAPVASAVFARCDGTTSRAAACRDLGADNVTDAVDALGAAGLLEGLDRRAVLRRGAYVGGLAIAGPLLISALTPAAAAAASTTPPVTVGRNPPPGNPPPGNPPPGNPPPGTTVAGAPGGLTTGTSGTRVSGAGLTQGVSAGADGLPFTGPGDAVTVAEAGIGLLAAGVLAVGAASAVRARPVDSDPAG